jgi:hypothetical protein
LITVYISLCEVTSGYCKNIAFSTPLIAVSKVEATQVPPRRLIDIPKNGTCPCGILFNMDES